MKKRIISSFLCAVMLSAYVLSCLTGCSASSDNKKNYTVLEWLDLVEENFNLLYYTEEEPLVGSVSTSDDSFETVQIAAEWGIIDPEDDLKFNGKLTKEFAADTLVRAMNCVTPSTVDISDSSKVKDLYLDNVMSSVNEGIFELSSGKFNPKKKLSAAEADEAMATAYDKWVNFSYGESFDRSTVQENVINLGGVTSENCEVVPAKYSVKYTGSESLFDANGNYSDTSNKTITFKPGEAPDGLKIDSVLALPADDVIPMNYAVVVTNVQKNADGSVTVTTRNAELQEVYDEIDIQQSGELDFSEAIFYGPDGKRLSFGNDSASMSDLFNDGEFVNLAMNPNDEGEMLNMANKKSATLKLGDGFSAKLSVSLNKSGGGMGFEIKGKCKEGDADLSAAIGFEDELKVENRLKTHWDWFALKVDELKFSLNDTRTESASFDCSLTKNFGKSKNHYGDANGDGKTTINDHNYETAKLRQLYKDVQGVDKGWTALKKSSTAATNYKLVDVFFPSTNIHIVVRAEVSVQGSLKLTFTQSNTTGVELVKGKLRSIKDSSNSQDIDFSAKVELAGRLAIELQLIGINVADLGVKAGIGVKVGSKLSRYDKSTDSLLEVCGIDGGAVLPGTSADAGEGIGISECGLEIPTDDTSTIRICNEFTFYPILTVFACSSSSVVGKLFTSFEWEVYNEDSPFFQVHYEIDENGGGLVTECTRTANESYNITTGDKLTLNMENYAISVSEEADTGLAIVTLPKKTTIKDVKITCDNPDILEVENLLNQPTTKTLKPTPVKDLKITSNASQAFGKKISIEGKDSVTIKNVGPWFYEGVSDEKKSQFALTGKKNGTANVTITAGKDSVTIPVKVGTGIEEVESSGALTISKGTFTLTPGETAQTAFEFIPEGKTIADISFESANSAVATVTKGGLIKAVEMGDTVVIATLKADGEIYTATFTIHVIVPPSRI